MRTHTIFASEYTGMCILRRLLSYLIPGRASTSRRFRAVSFAFIFAFIDDSSLIKLNLILRYFNYRRWLVDKILLIRVLLVAAHFSVIVLSASWILTRKKIHICEYNLFRSEKQIKNWSKIIRNSLRKDILRNILVVLQVCFYTPTLNANVSFTC